MYGASITPALVCALFYKKATKLGGLCGIIAGGVGTIIWEIVLHSPYGIKSAIITVPLAFLVIFIVSNLTQNRELVPLETLYQNKNALEESK